jgi:predicted Fe-Mo cluster-binding NifX family protein
MEHKDAVQKIAVTIWGPRVSPVFDSARLLLIAELVDGGIAGMSSLEFDPGRPTQLVQLLRDRGIGVIICGAVSDGPADMLEAGGIKVIPFITGNVGKVLETYIRGNPEWTEFTMPGCAGNNFCCRGKIRRGCELTGSLPLGRQRRKIRQAPEVAAGRDSENYGSETVRGNIAEAVPQGVNIPIEEE